MAYIQSSLCLLSACLLSTICITFAQQTQCWSCASKYLHDNWAITGLIKPPRLNRTDECETTIGVPQEVGDPVPCDGVCAEILMTYRTKEGGKAYGAVRGCYKELTGLTSRSVACSFGFTDGNYTSANHTYGVNQLNVLLPDYMAIYTSANVSSTTLTLPTRLEEFDKMFLDGQCKNTSNDPAQFLTCKSCDERLNEPCGPKVDSTCMAPLCTKLEYQENGINRVKRGCAPVSFYSDDTCVPVMVSTEANAPTNNMARPRRDIRTMAQTGTHCFCNADSCNSATGVALSSLLFIAVTLLIL